MTGVLLIQGVQLPYEVVEHAFEWAKEYEAELRVYFLTSDEVLKEDYPFPSDLDASQNLTDAGDAGEGKLQIMRHHRKFLHKRASASHLELSTEVLMHPSVQDVINRCKDADRLFAADDAGEEKSLEKNLDFSMTDLLGEMREKGIAVDNTASA